MFYGRGIVGYDGEEIGPKILMLAGRGLEAATIHLLNRTRETLSVPAPRKRNAMGRYRATVPATPGAPPRKLSGDLRRSMAYQMFRQKTIGRVGTNKVYARPLEGWMNHSFLYYTLDKSVGELTVILKSAWGGTSTQIGFNS